MRSRLGIFAAACLTAAAAVGFAAPAAFAAPENANFAGASGDGSRVFFQTAEQMVSTDTDHAVDVYERSAGKTSLVSKGAINGNRALNASFAGASTDGTRVFFQTSEPLVSGDTDSSRDIYERSGGTTTEVSKGAINGNGAFDVSYRGMSATGNRVFFESAEKLAATDSDSAVDVYQNLSGTTSQVSLGAVNGNGAFDAKFRGSSADGATVFFTTAERLTATDTDASTDLYQRAAGVTTRISAGSPGCAPACGNGAFPARFQGTSADGSHVYFTTSESLATGDTDSANDIYERSAGATNRVSLGSENSNNSKGADFDGVSADGSHVFFSTHSKLETTDTDHATDIYDRSVGITVQVSQGKVNGNQNLNADFKDNSSDGAHVFFQTREKLRHGDDDGGAIDVYDRSAGDTTRVSRSEEPGDAGAADAQYEGASSGGGRVFFDTREQLDATDTDSATDVYQRAGGTTQVSQGAINGNGAFAANFKGASTDGSHVFFGTQERLVASDADTLRDVYERSAETTTLVSVHLVPPQTKITKGPKKRTRDRTPTFKYKSSDPGSTFKCKVDKAPFKSCKPKGFTTKKLKFHKHTFQVRATNSSGSTDPTPAKKSFKVVR